MSIGEVIKIQGKQLFVDLIVFEMLDFDMILKMDILGRDETDTNYRHKKVWFSLKDRD